MSSMQQHGDTLDATWERLRKLTENLDRQFHLRQKFEHGRQYAVEHPVATMFSLLTLAFCSVPLLCFIGFAIVSFLVTFVGFLFVEGILLTIGTLMLGGVLCVVGFLSLGVGTFLALAWVSARTGHRLIGQIRTMKQARTTQEQKGACVKDSDREKDM